MVSKKRIMTVKKLQSKMSFLTDFTYERKKKNKNMNLPMCLNLFLGICNLIFS